jgi:hypothetical protein
MPGLVPGIHVLSFTRKDNAWMAGTSPAMTMQSGVWMAGTSRAKTRLALLRP